MDSRPPRQHAEWLQIGKDVPPNRRSLLVTLSFLLPLLTWSIVSYVPFVWHPLVKVDNPGSVSYFEQGMLVDRDTFADENRTARAEARAVATGSRANPVYLPAPHEVARALYVAFKTPPRLPRKTITCPNPSGDVPEAAEVFSNTAVNASRVDGFTR